MSDDDHVEPDDLRVILREISKLGDQRLFRETRTVLLKLLLDFADRQPRATPAPRRKRRR